MAEIPLIDIRPDHWEIVRDILSKYVPQYEVWAFGSRAKWTAKPYSDLDIAIVTDKPLPLGISAGLTDEFSESDLPYRVDVVDMFGVSETFRAIIERDKVLLVGLKDVRWQTPLGLLPNGWHLARLGDVARKVGSGATPTGGDKVYLTSRDKFALIRSQCVHDRFFDDVSISFISDDDAYRLRSAEVMPGDVLLNITGDGITFGRSCLAPAEVLPACVNQHVSIIRPDPEKLNSGYLLSYLTHPSIKDYIESFNAGGSRRAITKGHIESFKIPLPPIDEQRVIASVLGALDDKIDLNRRMNETLEAMARAIFKDWFVDFGPVRAKAEGREPYLAPELWSLFPDALDDEDKPVGWRMASIGDIFAINPPEPLRKGCVAPYLDMAALPTQGCWPDTPIPREFSSGTRFRNGDTLLARITPCLENGKSAFVRSLDDDEVGWGSTEFIVMRPLKPFPLAYGYILARDDKFREHAIQSMTGTSGRQRVQTDTLCQYMVSVPAPQVLNAFGALIDPWFDLIKANAQQSDSLSQLRDLLLPKLMSGEIRLRDAEKAVEAAL